MYRNIVEDVVIFLFDISVCAIYGVYVIHVDGYQRIYCTLLHFLGYQQSYYVYSHLPPKVCHCMVTSLVVHIQSVN